MNHIKNAISAIAVCLLSTSYALCASNVKPIRGVVADRLPKYEFCFDGRPDCVSSDMREGGTEPVIYRGAAKNWEQASLTPDYFAMKYGNTPLLMGDFIPRDTCTTYALHREDMKTPCTSFEQPLCSGRYYVEEELSETDSLHGSGQHFPRRSTIMLIGPENIKTPLHQHGSTFLAQIYGSKVVTLIDPAHLSALSAISFEQNDCLGLESTSCRWDDLDLHNPSVLAKIEAAGIPIYQDTLYPGDVLYIPDQWLHDVKSNGESVSIAYGF